MIKGSVASLLPLALVAAVGMASAQPRGWRHVPSIMRSVPSVRCTLSAGSPGINGDKMKRSRLLLMLVAALVALGAWAADYPAPQEGSWVVHDFRFHTGETLRELRLHYTTVGAGVCRRAVRTGTAARRESLLHHPARRDRHG